MLRVMSAVLMNHLINGGRAPKGTGVAQTISLFLPSVFGMTQTCFHQPNVLFLHNSRNNGDKHVLKSLKLRVKWVFLPREVIITDNC